MNTSVEITRPAEIVLSREIFPPPLRQGQFDPLFHEHAMEVRGKSFKLNYNAYYRIEREERLVWIVARDAAGDDRPIGYSCSFWFRSLHFDEKIGADDLWFVLPAFRRNGIGRQLKLMGHDALKAAGVTEIRDNIRGEFDHPTLMQDIGFEAWGTIWRKKV